MMAVPLLLGALLTACAEDVPMGVEIDAGPEGLSAVDVDFEDMVETFEEVPPVDAPTKIAEDDGGPYTEDVLAEMTTEELHELWFGDSDWDCCYSSKCASLRDRCADDEVMTTNGLGTVCCSPDIGQCPDDGWDDVDAGIGAP